MDMVMTLYMGSWAPPAMSLPRVTHRPSLTIRRTGQIPEQMFTLESPQWTTTTPASRMAARSRSSDQTQWAMSVWSFQRPYLSYVSQYWLHSGCSSFTQAISLVLSDRWDWTYSPLAASDAAQLGHQLVGAAGREAGRDNGLDVLKMAVLQPAQRLRPRTPPSSPAACRAGRCGPC